MLLFLPCQKEPRRRGRGRGRRHALKNLFVIGIAFLLTVVHLLWGQRTSQRRVSLTINVIHHHDTAHHHRHHGAIDNNSSSNTTSQTSLVAKDSPTDDPSFPSSLPFATRNPQAPPCHALVDATAINFTLVTQTSLDRLWLLEKHCQQWPGAISVAVGVPDDVHATHVVYQQVQAMLSSSCRDRVTISVVAEYDTPVEYPVNRLRNLALRAIATTHAVYVDIDFLPTRHLHDELLAVRAHFLASDPQTALVLPAFALVPWLCRVPKEGWTRNCTAAHLSHIPDTQAELRQRYYVPHNKKDKRAGHYMIFDGTGNPEGHSSTNYPAWFHQAAGTVQPLSCIASDRYEPYVVFRYCRSVPPFPEQFTGYGRNKMVWIQLLRRLGWQFATLGGNAFLTHVPHDKSPACRTWRTAKKNNKKKLYETTAVVQLSDTFRQWMLQHVPNQSVVSYCKNDTTTFTTTTARNNSSFPVPPEDNDPSHYWYES